MLEGLNYSTLTASNGQEALAVYDAHRAEISLILTDVVMPGMSGRELCAAFRERDPGIPLVIMTGYSSGPDTQFQGVAGVLNKPLMLENLAQVVSDALRGGNLPCAN